LGDRLLNRPGYGSGGLLNLSSHFTDLAELWLAELELREISEGTKENYRDDLRVHVGPYFENFTLGEITTGRVEAFLKSQAAVSYSRAKHSRTLLNQLFGYALRHDALARNPVEGTSPLRKPRGAPQALTLEQIAAIRTAAAAWRTAPDRKGPKPDDKVRDLIEVLTGTSMRPGEALALRPHDIEDGPRGMVAHVRGTTVYQQGRGSFRQEHPKTGASVRSVPVPEFAAVVLRRRLAQMTPQQSEQTIFANRTGGVLSQLNVRRTFREFLTIAGLKNSGITPRWYRARGRPCSPAVSASTRRPHTSATPPKRSPRRTTSSPTGRSTSVQPRFWNSPSAPTRLTALCSRDLRRPRKSVCWTGSIHKRMRTLTKWRDERRRAEAPRNAFGVTHSRPASWRICRQPRSTLLTCCVTPHFSGGPSPGH
jgi:integrase